VTFDLKRPTEEPRIREGEEPGKETRERRRRGEEEKRRRMDVQIEENDG